MKAYACPKPCGQVTVQHPPIAARVIGATRLPGARVFASTMSTATTSSAPDLASQWAALSDADVSLGNVEELLKHIQDELWVPAACADRILDDVAAQQALLDLGVERTTAVVERVRKATAQAVSGGDEELESPVEGTEDSSQRARHAALASYFAEASTDAQLCRIRALLLERLDKLNTWIQICREAPVSSGNE